MLVNRVITNRRHAHCKQRRQFLDFWLNAPQEVGPLRAFCAQNGKRPLLRLDFDLTSGRYTLLDVLAANRNRETGSLLRRCTILWMYSTESGFPLPFLRFNPPRTFIDGPDNWAHIQVRKLSEDSAGNTHRITLAFDQLAKNMPAALAPCENDLLNGTFCARGAI